MFKKEWVTNDRQLAAQYQKGIDRDNVIATIKKRYFNSLLATARNSNYNKIFDEWDKESYLYESIHVSLCKFKADSKTVFYSYLRTVYMNRLRQEGQYLMASTMGRNWYMGYEDGNSTSDTNGDEYSLFERGLGASEQTDMDYVNFVHTIASFQLTINQQKYINYLMECQYIPTDAEAAREIGISRAAIGGLRKSLRTKMSEMI